MKMWTVPFRTYLEFDGVKEGIQQMKYRKKMQQKERGFKQFGMRIEEGVSKIIADIPGFEVKTLSPQMDMGFGADIQVSYKEEDKNYSFFADITSNEEKYNVSYLTQGGDTTDDLDEAFCYCTEYFKVRFGLKKQHASWFYYEKPVVVVLIEDYVPTTGLALHHINNIGNILISLNSLLVRRGFGARASQKVRPNPKRFYDEYSKSK
jgi:hypothetical protein